ncbi:chemotaxis protein CheB [Nocardia sp. 2]|uniref:protein-glutamate methylesterase n=1 Tax=Nocardia acididurans TaxID=2802282 RepID=A0ABS1M2X1_9NOCA|nr:chemotaxis protein CheB [Nocardia acididurans]MBL1075018.1 chemotaxis protein CheB [Nocardia acididurans]
MEPSDVIVVGASAGGVEALRDFVRGLPGDIEAAVLVVLHMPPRGVSALPAILGRAGPLPAVAGTSGTVLMPGRIYAAVPDHHLLVADGRIVLSHGPTENGHRPGVDALFRSAAVAWGSRVAGVVLSGSLDDGTAGLSLIRERGGVTAVQDPEEALYRSMPESAITNVPVDLVLPARELGAAMAKLLKARRELPAPAPLSDMDRLEAEIDAGEGISRNGVVAMTEPSGMSCPDCNGGLFSLPGGKRFRCRVGHAWTAEALLVEQSVEVEKALWTALRALQEKQQLASRMYADARTRGDMRLAERYAEQQAEHAESVKVLRKLLVERRSE